MEKVESISRNLLRIAAFAERFLQRLKTALACGIDDDRLHVQHGVPGLQFFERRNEGRKAFGPVLSVPGTQTRLAAGHETQQTITVELNLMQPCCAPPRLLDERGP